MDSEGRRDGSGIHVLVREVARDYVQFFGMYVS